MAARRARDPELGKNAINRRARALREMNKAGGAAYVRYSRGDATYHVRAPGGQERLMETRQVEAYVLGQSDAYAGLTARHLREAVDSALADPEVTDREQLLRQVERELERRVGVHLRAAAAHFTDPEAPAPDTQVA